MFLNCQRQSPNLSKHPKIIIELDILIWESHSSVMRFFRLNFHLISMFFFTHFIHQNCLWKQCSNCVWMTFNPADWKQSDNIRMMFGTFRFKHIVLVYWNVSSFWNNIWISKRLGDFWSLSLGNIRTMNHVMRIS